MPYCDLDDLKARVPEDVLISLTDDDDIGVIDTDKTDEAIAAADALVNGYLSRRYPVPVSPVPAVVKKLSVDIAVYELFSRLERASETTRDRYRDAVKFLKDVSESRADIAGAVTPAENSSNAPVITSAERIFSRSKMEGF